MTFIYSLITATCVFATVCFWSAMIYYRDAYRQAMKGWEEAKNGWSRALKRERDLLVDLEEGRRDDWWKGN